MVEFYPIEQEGTLPTNRRACAPRRLWLEWAPVRTSTLVTRTAAWFILSGSAVAQPAPTIVFSPSVLIARSGPAPLHISILQGPSASLGVRWNGVEKPSANPNPQFSGGYDIQLTADDLASPGMAEVSLFDRKTGATVATRFAFIGYNVRPNDVVYDPGRNRFYVTTPSDSKDPAFPPNSLVAIDPGTPRVGPALAIGNSPASLALADDGSALYVAVDGDGVVRRVNLDTFSVAGEFRFRAAASNPNGFARSAIALMPGNPQVIAIYQHPNVASSLTALSVYDNGQKRAAEMQANDGYDSLLFAPDGKSVFLGSYANFNSPQTVLRYSVDATGVPKQTPAPVAGGGLVGVQNGLLYTSRGTVIDLQKMQVVASLGVGGAIAVDPANRRVFAAYFRQSGYLEDYPQYLQAFDLATQQPLGWFFFDSWFYFDAGANPGQRLFRFGSDGLLYTGSKALLLFHTPLAGPAPVVTAAGIVNSASQQAAAIASGEILTVYGANLGPAAPVGARLNSAGAYDRSLSYVQAWFDQTPGTVLLASNSQVNVIAPFAIRPGSTVNLQLWYFGIPSVRIPLTVVPAAPALYTRNGSGGGPVAVVNQDGSINAPSPPGSFVTLFGTGAGALPGAADGALARSAQSLPAPVRVTIGGKDAPVAYAGSAPFLPNGMFQLNVQVPAGVASGVAPIIVTINGQDSPKGATLEIR
jgi:uncharacterized protein (TIGR03437 family)